MHWYNRTERHVHSWDEVIRITIPYRKTGWSEHVVYAADSSNHVERTLGTNVRCSRRDRSENAGWLPGRNGIYKTSTAVRRDATTEGGRRWRSIRRMHIKAKSWLRS